MEHLAEAQILEKTITALVEDVSRSRTRTGISTAPGATGGAGRSAQLVELQGEHVDMELRIADESATILSM